eukprot:1317314-Prymnesium_polylepis.1
MRRMRTTGTRWPTWPTSSTVPEALRMAGATVVELAQEDLQELDGPRCTPPLHCMYTCTDARSPLHSDRLASG